MEQLTPIARSVSPEFPRSEIATRLRDEIATLADDLGTIRAEWEPNLDSLAIVGVISVVSDLCDFPLPPEQVVRPGGYKSVDEAVDDITNRIQRLSETRART
jgi:hypothetical protein